MRDNTSCYSITPSFDYCKRRSFAFVIIRLDELFQLMKEEQENRYRNVPTHHQRTHHRIDETLGTHARTHVKTARFIRTSSLLYIRLSG